MLVQPSADDVVLSARLQRAHGAFDDALRAVAF
jgi:hypothetical protein